MHHASHSCLASNQNNHILFTQFIVMKKIFIAACVFMLMATAAHAQRYAIVDSKYILEKLDEYKDAQKKLDQVSEDWQKEIDTKQATLDRMYKEYEAEQVMLTDELKKKREDELFNRE